RVQSDDGEGGRAALLRRSERRGDGPAPPDEQADARAPLGSGARLAEERDPMKPERWERIERLFARASELPADEQAAFLRREAGDDPSIVAEVERMLAARSDGSRFMEPPESIGGPPPADLDAEWIGRKFDDFELTGRIGRGGMGIVFRARQASLAR